MSVDTYSGMVIIELLRKGSGNSLLKDTQYSFQGELLIYLQEYKQNNRMEVPQTFDEEDGFN